MSLLTMRRTMDRGLTAGIDILVTAAISIAAGVR
jgi:hypothetical protein